MLSNTVGTSCVMNVDDDCEMHNTAPGMPSYGDPVYDYYLHPNYDGGTFEGMPNA